MEHKKKIFIEDFLDKLFVLVPNPPSEIFSKLNYTG